MESKTINTCSQMYSILLNNWHMLLTWFLTRFDYCICVVFIPLNFWAHVDYCIRVVFYSITFLNCVDYFIRVFYSITVLEHMLIIAFVFFADSITFLNHVDDCIGDFFNSNTFLTRVHNCIYVVLIPSLFWIIVDYNGLYEKS